MPNQSFFSYNPFLISYSKGNISNFEQRSSEYTFKALMS